MSSTSQNSHLAEDDLTPVAQRFVQLTVVNEILRLTLGEARKIIEESCNNKLCELFEESPNTTHVELSDDDIGERLQFERRIVQMSSNEDSLDGKYIAIDKSLAEGDVKSAVFEYVLAKQERSDQALFKKEPNGKLIASPEIDHKTDETFLSFVDKCSDYEDCITVKYMRNPLNTVLSSKNSSLPSSESLYNSCKDDAADPLIQEFSSEWYAFWPRKNSSASSILRTEKAGSLAFNDSFMKFLKEIDFSVIFFRQFFTLFQHRIRPAIFDEASGFSVAGPEIRSILKKFFNTSTPTDQKNSINLFLVLRKSWTNLYLASKDFEQSNEQLLHDYCKNQQIENKCVDLVPQKEKRFIQGDIMSLDFKKVLENNLPDSDVALIHSSDSTFLTEQFFKKVVLKMFQYEFDWKAYFRNADETTSKKIKSLMNSSSNNYSVQALSANLEDVHRKLETHAERYRDGLANSMRWKAYAFSKIYDFIEKLPYLRVDVRTDENGRSFCKIVEHEQVQIDSKAQKFLEKNKKAFCNFFKFDPNSEDALAFRKKLGEVRNALKKSEKENSYEELKVQHTRKKKIL